MQLKGSANSAASLRFAALSYLPSHYCEARIQFVVTLFFPTYVRLDSCSDTCTRAAHLLHGRTYHISTHGVLHLFQRHAHIRQYLGGVE